MIALLLWAPIVLTGEKIEVPVPPVQIAVPAPAPTGIVAIEPYVKRFQRCYENSLKSVPLVGQVIIGVEARADGRVTRAWVELDELVDRSIALCFVRQARRLTFPPGRHLLPFRFMPANANIDPKPPSQRGTAPP